jgi:arsenate reductase-like glutaredoxin family protein
MGVISQHHRQMKLYYHSETNIGKQTYAYAESSKKKLLAIDIAKTKVTGTQWLEIADGLGLPIAELVNQDLPHFRETYGTDAMDFDETDWLKILDKEPILLRHPILVDGDAYLQIKSGAAFKEHMEPDSAGIEKTPKR